MKNIKQAADEYAKSMYNESDDTFDSCKEDFMAGIRFAQRFIPVEEELPENNTNFPFDKYFVEVDIFAKNYSCHTVTTATYECGKWSTDRNDIDIIEISVTHWRPINHK